MFLPIRSLQRLPPAWRGVIASVAVSVIVVVLSDITMHSQTVTGTESSGFQSACVWPNTAKQVGGVISRKPDFGFIVQNKSVAEMVQWSFGGWNRQRFVVYGGLDWTRHERFHVEIRFPGHASTQQAAAMLRGVLRAVFKLSVHWETRGAMIDATEEPVDVLVVEPVWRWETALEGAAAAPYCIKGALVPSDDTELAEPSHQLNPLNRTF